MWLLIYCESLVGQFSSWFFQNKSFSFYISTSKQKFYFNESLFKKKKHQLSKALCQTHPQTSSCKHISLTSTHKLFDQETAILISFTKVVHGRWHQDTEAITDSSALFNWSTNLLVAPTPTYETLKPYCDIIFGSQEKWGKFGVFRKRVIVLAQSVIFFIHQNWYLVMLAYWGNILVEGLEGSD